MLCNKFTELHNLYLIQEWLIVVITCTFTYYTFTFTCTCTVHSIMEASTKCWLVIVHWVCTCTCCSMSNLQNTCVTWLHDYTEYVTCSNINYYYTTAGKYFWWA